jgi:hypothetical protein
VNSLRSIRPGDGQGKWIWRDEEGIRLLNPESVEGGLVSGETSREEFDITGSVGFAAEADFLVKLFYVPGANDDVVSRRRFAEEALSCVATELGVDQFDTLILSLPGITLEKDEEDYNSKEFPVRDETSQSWVDTWKVFLLILYL